MSRNRSGRAARLRLRELRSALSNRIQLLLSKSEKQAKLDQSFISEVHQVCVTISHFDERVNSESSASRATSKEDRALRGLLNQIEERIEFLAQQRTENINIGKSRATILGKDSDWRALKPSSGPKTTVSQ